jgi:hypothetical protein
VSAWWVLVAFVLGMIVAAVCIVVLLKPENWFRPPGW